MGNSSTPAWALLLLLISTCFSFVCAFSPTAPFGFGAAAPSSLSAATALCVSLQQLDDSNMNDLMFKPPHGKAVLVDAYAPWCGPCKLIEPYLEECAKKYSEQLSVVKYDVEGDNNKNLKVEMLLQGVMVRGLPTLLLYNNGSPLVTHSGAITETGLQQWLEDGLGTATAAATIANGDKPKEQELTNDAAHQDDAPGGKRGFVSFAVGKDDYSL